MSKAGAFCLSLVLGLAGLAVLLVPSGPESRENVLADATLPAPTIPAQAWLPFLYRQITPTPLPTPTTRPPGVYASIDYNCWGWEEHSGPTDCTGYAEILNLTAGCIEVRGITVYALDAEGRPLGPMQMRPGVDIPLLNPGRSSPTRFDLRRLPVGYRDIRDIRMDIDWRTTDKSIVDLTATYLGCRTTCDIEMQTCDIMISGGVANPTDQVLLAPRVVFYQGLDQWERYSRWCYRSLTNPILPGQVITLTNLYCGFCYVGWCPCGYQARAIAFPPEACRESNSTFASVPIARQSGIFAVEFDVRPTSSYMNGVTGLSRGPATAFTDLGPIIRFSPEGGIEVRNGGSYQYIHHDYGSTSDLRFRIAVDIPNHTYDVYLREGLDLSENLVAIGCAFRTEQSDVTSLDHWNIWSDTGSLVVCNFRVVPE